jgi:ketosteroid isomerase-like protein
VSQADVDALRAGFDALSRRGLDGLLEYIHPDFETSTPPELTVEPDTYSGHDGLRRYFAGFEGAMEDVRFIPDEYLDAGDCVVIPMRLVAKGVETGIEVDQRFVQVWWLRDGKGIRLETFPDREAAFAAAGIEG